MGQPNSWLYLLGRLTAQSSQILYIVCGKHILPTKLHIECNIGLFI